MKTVQKLHNEAEMERNRMAFYERFRKIELKRCMYCGGVNFTQEFKNSECCSASCSAYYHNEKRRTDLQVPVRMNITF